MEFCPHCSFELAKAEPVTCGDFTIYPSGQFIYKGKHVDVTSLQGRLLHTLARAKGRYIGTEILGARISDAEDPYRLALVVIAHMKKRLRPQGVPLPIRTKNSLGMTWDSQADLTKPKGL